MWFLGLARSALNIADYVPLIGNLIKHIGKTVAGGTTGLPEVIRVFADDPPRAIAALTAYVNRRGPIGVCQLPIHFINFFFKFI